MKRLFLTLITIGLIVNSSFAQVGINTTSPNKSAALHINGGTKKGLLIPVMSYENREGILSPANGLMVYDEGQKIFFFYNATNWIALNPLQATDSTTSTLRLADGDTTITFDNNIIVNKAFTVNGVTTLKAPVTIDNSLTVNNNINAGTYSINAGTANASTVNATTVNATNGYGITPIGGIIMWSGTTAPDGWAICNGSISNGIVTPNLCGRFIVGYNPADADYNAIKKIGGEKAVLLNIEQMPKHQHYSKRGTQGSVSGGKGNDSSVGQYDDPYHPELFYTSPSGGDDDGNTSPHENRPPYYVLAYIMRVK